MTQSAQKREMFHRLLAISIGAQNIVKATPFNVQAYVYNFQPKLYYGVNQGKAYPKLQL
jgi:hypothetical protein